MQDKTRTRSDNFEELVALSSVLEKDKSALDMWHGALRGALSLPSRSGSINAERNTRLAYLAKQMEATREELQSLHEETIRILDSQTSLNPPRD